ncbi:hypothetical protein WJX73_009462 [Symbiochloris irregularis]|uniref:Uncharacterized protein n=1 Tax=Symbiochloris irregularis TaxID=706552 RepID=A0AAW1PZ54_9CHLO
MQRKGTAWAFMSKDGFLEASRASNGPVLTLLAPVSTRTPTVGRSGAPLVSRAMAAKSKIAPAASGDEKQSRQAKAIEAAMKDINSKCGSGTVMHFGAGQDFEATKMYPTGALTLDYALGGGYPEGKIIEIYGMESSGKSTLAMHAMAEVQKQGGAVCLIDTEAALDRTFARRLGMRLDNQTFVYCAAACGEDAFYTMEKLICSEGFRMIVVDSVSALLPRAELEGDVGSPQVGTQARLMSQGLRKVNLLCSKYNCSIVFLNQIRNKIIAYGNPETTSGGMALRFYASMRIKLARSKQGAPGMDARGQESGIRVKAQVVKNKCAPPFRYAEFDILFRKGISAAGCIVDVGEKLGVLKRRGSWYYYNDSQLAQGREKTLAALSEDKQLAAEVEAAVRSKLESEDTEGISELFEDVDDSIDSDDLIEMAEEDLDDELAVQTV